MQNTNNSAFPLMISIVVIDAAQMQSVYALLGGASLATLAATAVDIPSKNVGAKQDTAPATGGDETLVQEEPASGGTGPNATTAASPSDGVDAHGHPWSADLHASTKGKTKDGLWRMKVGVTRPAPLPGFPVESGASTAGTGTSPDTSAPSATSQTVTEPASDQPATSGTEGEDDEFAAFRAAAAASDATDQAAAAAVQPRKFSDADLGALCNQAAVKLGDPTPVKEIITRYVPEGQVAHSRNIPEDQRETFAKEVEAKAGIEFAG